MGRCANCYEPLPLPTRRGGRRQKFCNQACEQQFYRRHKKAAKEVDAHLQRLFKMSFKVLEEMHDTARAQLDEERAHVDLLESLLTIYRRRDEEMVADYLARLKALGMSEEQIKDFHHYWRDHTGRIIDVD